MRWLSPLYESLRLQDYPNTSIYLVDNASVDDSIKMTLNRYPEVTVIRLSKNLGYCMAYNLTMSCAWDDGCDWVIWSNNDILVEKNCLSEMVNAVQNDSHIGVVGPAFLKWNNDEPNYYMRGKHPYAIPAMSSRSFTPVEVDWVEGSFLMVKRQCVETVGPLDPYLFFYWEEADFCRRALQLGWRVVLVPRALARHYGGGSSEADKRNKTSTNFLQSRNYYIYKLANPRQHFLKNIIDGIHLFGVKLKKSYKDSALLICNIRIFCKVLGEIKTIYLKWIRDRRKETPSLTTKEFSNIEIEVLN